MRFISSSYVSSFGSLIAIALWLNAEHSDGFSPVRTSSYRRALINEQQSISTLMSQQTKLMAAFEPLPSPGVAHNQPKTKIIEKEVYDEPDEETRSKADVMLSEAVEEKETQDVKGKNNIVPHEPEGSPMQNLSKFLQFVSKHHREIALAALVSAATFLSPQKAIAAPSGGRLGGSFSPSRQSTVRTMPRTSSYSSRSYYSSRPNVYVNPFPVSPFVSPYTPFFGSPFYGYGRPGLIVQTRGPGILSLLVFGAMALAVTNAVSNIGSSMSSTSSSIFDTFDDTRGTVSSALGPGVSVVSVSVAMEVPNRDSPNSILSVLSKLADTARTDSRVGLSNLSSQVALELLRRKSSIVAASTKYNHYKDRTRAQQNFNNIAVKERGKFEKETKSVYGGVDYSPDRSRFQASSSSPTMAVVTLIIAIEGDSTKVPKIRSMGDVEETLRTIASDTKVDNCLQSAEILWTPEERTDSLSKRDVAADYPELLSI